MPFRVVGYNKPIDDSSLAGMRQSVLDLVQWTTYEFQQVASALVGTEAEKIWNSVPPKPRRGTIAYADGTNWNPGAGEGPYYFNGTNWISMKGSPIPGITDGSAAAAGMVGELLSATAAAVAYAGTGVVTNVCSLTLTPGDWDVSGNVLHNLDPLTVQVLAASISATSATGDNNRQTQLSFGTFTSMYGVNTPVVPSQFNVTVNTPIYLVGEASWSGGTSGNMYGWLRARRMR